MKLSLIQMNSSQDRDTNVARACQFIDQAVKDGKKVGEEVLPACAEACPAHAIYFGDLDDPDSQVSRLLASRQWLRLREEMGTSPKVFYLLK